MKTNQHPTTENGEARFRRAECLKHAFGCASQAFCGGVLLALGFRQAFFFAGAALFLAGAIFSFDLTRRCLGKLVRSDME